MLMRCQKQPIKVNGVSILPYATIILAVYPLDLQIIKVLFFYLCVLDETTVYYDVYTDSGSWLYKCM